MTSDTETLRKRHRLAGARHRGQRVDLRAQVQFDLAQPSQWEQGVRAE
jgi:hypothetical protein